MHRLRTSATLWQLPRALTYQIPSRNFTAAARRFDTTLEQNSSDNLDPITTKSEPSVSIPQSIGHKDDSHNPPSVNKGTDASAAAKDTARHHPFYVGEQELYLHLGPKKTLKLPYTYLRDLCQCRGCKDEHSKQRSFRTSDIPPNIAPSRVNWDGKTLSITWASDILGSGDTHVSTWDRKFLLNPVLNTHRQHSLRVTEPVPWGKSGMGSMQHWVSYEDYMNDEFKFAFSMRQLQRLGLIFVQGIPESREMVEKIATRMGPLRNTFYGSTFDVRTVPEATNVAYTNQFLGFHMDLMYMNEPPGYQLLHCLENSCSGGESMFGDTFHAARIMKASHPKEYKILSKQRLGYEYRHENHIYYNERPVFEHDPKTGHLIHVNYSPPFQSPLPTPDGRDHHAGFVNKLRDSLSKFAAILDDKERIFEMKLNPGECVIFDNRRILHARRQFDSSEGSRWLAGAYVDTDALLSRFAVCKRQHPDAWAREVEKIRLASGMRTRMQWRKE
ncbi:Taurine catabolism dioxygenase TauD/TfdA [Penicillium bovifimosum]|uniref:Taurine catabolism dioxygenase TauD/TfdA n=1 Tax=Penicillium bovifimosum TaxID=126998 RepID=A0A9W9GP56_9EURO|nr:Taurine catabolism dioxygenase TauD/TfdA [Penicillium bovifimosum]KAJ5125089.1 Taurine catabolism dioxygenase TauD/TfdA [Penicillium bovifimosum]